MGVEIIPKDDLRLFRHELLDDIKALLSLKAEQPEEWLKTSEVRDILKMSPGTLLTLRASGQLEYSKVGGTYYYRYQDIQKMLLKPVLVMNESFLFTKIFAIMARDQRITVWHFSIYMSVYNEWLISGMTNPVAISRSRIMRQAHIGSIVTYHKCI